MEPAILIGKLMSIKKEEDRKYTNLMFHFD